MRLVPCCHYARHHAVAPCVHQMISGTAGMQFLGIGLGVEGELVVVMGDGGGY